MGVVWGLVTAFAAKVMKDPASYFEASVCLLCSILAVLTSRHLGLSTLTSLVTTGLVQQRYTFMNMSILSGSATRNFVHGVSTLLEVVLLVLLGNELSRLAIDGLVEGAVTLAVVGLSTAVVARGVSCLLTSTVITSLGIPMGTIDARWLAIITVGALRGPCTYGGQSPPTTNFSALPCLLRQPNLQQQCEVVQTGDRPGDPWDAGGAGGAQPGGEGEGDVARC